MPDFDRAFEIALQAHRGQTDRYGAVYIFHPIRVMMRVEGETAQLAAILHDVVEDSHWTISDLQKEGFANEVIDAVDALTNRDGEAYEEYIERLLPNPVARKVKLADLRDNMDMTRMDKFTEEVPNRMKRYHKAWLRINKVEEEGKPSRS